MLRHLLATLALALWLIAPVPGLTSDTGSGIYRVLHQGGYLEDYMIDAVSEIAGTLVEAAERWSGYGVNRPYSKGLVNIYLVNSERLPERNLLESFGVELASYSLRGNALAHEETGTLFVDTVLLKSLVTVALLSGEPNFDTAMAVGAIKARGIGAFRQLWDPGMNPALSNASYADRWVMLGSGALAFILAHEMGHIHLGVDNASKRRMPMRFKNKEDRDKHWVCQDLIGEKYQHQQRIEREADDFAVSVIRKVLFPPGVLSAPLLRYELGARWYII